VETAPAEVRRWFLLGVGLGFPKANLPLTSGDRVKLRYMPEIVFRAVMLHGLPDELVDEGPLTDKTLFWVDVEAYMAHPDNNMPLESVANHWKSVYALYFAGQMEKLFEIPYLRFDDPYAGDQ
jgi:hypothetical protein